MKINEKKSAIIFIKKIKDKGKTKKDETQIEKIPIQSSYKYLGVHLQEDLSFKEQSTKICEKMKSKANIIFTEKKFLNDA